jgi:hypothetical protein
VRDRARELWWKRRRRFAFEEMKKDSVARELVDKAADVDRWRSSQVDVD